MSSGSPKKAWRFILICFASLFLIAILLLSVVSLLLYTEAGSRRVSDFAISRANQIDDFHISAKNISGNLLRGLQFNNVVIGTSAATANIETLSTSWNPYSLLSGGFHVSAIAIQQARIELFSSPETENLSDDEDEINASLDITTLPIDISIGSFQALDCAVITGSSAFSLSQIELSGDLSGSELHLEKFELEMNDLFLNAELDASLVGDIPLSGTVRWDYRGALPLNYLSASGEGSITGSFRELTIEHELTAPVELSSSGQITSPLSTTLRSAKLEHRIDYLTTPIPELEEFTLVDASVSTEFSNNVLSINLATKLENPNFPLFTIEGSASLDSTELNLNDLRISTDSGNLNTVGRINYADFFSNELFEGQLDFNLREEDPLRYLPTTLSSNLSSNLPTTLNNIVTNGTISITPSDTVQRVQLSLASFNGEISDYAVSGNAELTSLGQRIEIDSLQLRTIDNSLFASGVIDESIDLSWQIQAPAINQLLLDFSGSVIADGSLAGTLDNPLLKSELKANDLEVGNISIAEVSLSLAGSIEDLSGTAALSQVGLILGDELQQIHGAEFSIDGSLASHRIVASVDSDFATVQLSAQGGYIASTTELWNGFLDSASVDTEFGNWEKSGSETAISYSQEVFGIAFHCWLAEATELCFSFDQIALEDLSFTAALNNFPLQEFNASSSDSRLFSYAELPQLPPEISLAGIVNGRADGVIRNGVPQINFELAANDSLLTIHETTNGIETNTRGSELNPGQSTANHDYAWQALNVTGSLFDEQWNINTSAVLAQDDLDDTGLALNGRLDSNLTVTANGSLQGFANATFEELSWIEAFLPDLSNISGQLNSDITIGGNIEAPIVSGSLNLKQTLLSLPALGITLENITGFLTADEDGFVALNGSLISNKGRMSIEGDISDLYDQKRELRLTLNGENFELASIPDVNFSVSPELYLVANEEVIDLQGDIHLAHLDVTLQELPETAIDVSRDAVVINYPADKPELARSIASEQSTFFNIPITADIQFTLGDEINVAGFGMEASLGGNLSVQQQTDGRNSAYGELNVTSGTYTLYGQSLELRQGKVLFFGALDNPALDIRAVREVETMTAGVLINGTLKSMRSELFSTPALPENDIISVLVTGRPFSELDEQGGTAVLGAIAKLGLGRAGGGGGGLTTRVQERLGLDALSIDSTGGINASVLTVGKYLTPKIFIRYGVGLFDRQSKVAIDYTLSERLKLEAESGEYQSVDLVYKVER